LHGTLNYPRYEEDTIAAIATPPGSGGIGVIRISGPASEEIGTRVFSRTGDGKWQTHRLYRGTVIDTRGKRLDEALAVVMRRPRSYTGEDVFEIHCHGSPVVLRQTLAAILHFGARPADRGEFTKRAFLNGRIDLTQAEAVINLIRARTAEGAGQAAAHLFGHLATHLDELREHLTRVKGLLEVQIDFSEDVDFDANETAAVIRSVLARVETLRRTYDRGRLVRDGIQVAITGRPNAGKSSLLNALLGTERAIVTPIPGTTRDVIEEAIDFGGVPIVLRDTAGLRDAPDEVERIGVERACDVVRTADVVLHVIDGSQSIGDEAKTILNTNTIIVINKVDLPRALAPSDLVSLAGHPIVEISATRRTGLDTLRQTILAGFDSEPVDGVPILNSARQFQALAEVRDILRSAIEGLEVGTPVDLVSVDVQAALDHIASITGAITNEYVLDVIFREFCIGK
jgi:tRNA modification GTPase